MNDASSLVRDAIARGDRASALRIARANHRAHPASLDAARLLATVLSEIDSDEAERAWRAVIALDPGDTEAHYMLGNAEGDRGNFAAAAEHFRAALVRAPMHPQLHASLGLALEELGELTEAETSFKQALRTQSDPPYALVASMGRNLFRQRRYAEALPYFDLLASKFGIGDPRLNAAYAASLAAMARTADADAVFRKVVTHDPEGVAARDYAAFLMRSERYRDAIRVLERMHVESRNDLLATSMLLVCRMHVADWRHVDGLRTKVIAAAARGLQGPDEIVPAYDFLAWSDDPMSQRVVAARWAREAVSVVAERPRRRHDTRKLRLGFVSSDYNNHPVGRLVIGLFERIDRDRFELFAYSTAQKSGGRFGDRIAAAVDRYCQLDEPDALENSRVIADAEIDVLFDLNGFSGVESIRLFAQRPSAVQVNFLGYTGTLGSPAYDFIVTDRYCVPPDRANAFSERLLYVDPCYLPSDPSREIATSTPSRADYGLPPHAFVFCAFAAPYKISPPLFDCWMQLLRNVPDSVLWLRQLPADTIERLRNEAAARGVDGARLISAPNEGIDRYLARFAIADLYLDSTPFGTHTTVNDALYAGLPVVTLAGTGFAARASASQLVAAELGDLVASDLANYVSLARELALDRKRLREIRPKLLDRSSLSLFDMDQYARAFEAAVTAVADR